MRKFLSVFFQFLLFLLVFFVGGIFWHPFRVQTVLRNDATQMRVFVWDGLILMVLLYGLVLLIELLMKQIRRAGAWSTVAVVLAGAAGLAMKFGFLTVDR